MISVSHRDRRGGRAFLGLQRVEARLILLQGPRRISDPSAGGLGGAVQGGNLRPQRKEQPLVLGGRQFQLMLVGSGACMFDPFLHVAERDQHYLGLHVGVEVIPDGG